MKKTFDNAPDLSKAAPRSPRARLAGFVQLARTLDKCRATIWSNPGEYKYDCPVDNILFKWKGITGSDLKAFVETGAPDEAVGEWVVNNGISKTPAEIKAWSDEREKSVSQYKEGLDALGLPAGTTTFDYLEADDKATFAKK